MRPTILYLHGIPMHDIAPVESPNDQQMDLLCDQLRSWSNRWVKASDWPAESLRLCGRAGVYRWFLPRTLGGQEWSEQDQTRGYLRLAEADLTTTFIITQYMGAMRRIASTGNHVMIERWLQPLADGERFGTVGISHLTTSRRHLKKPVLSATEVEGGFLLEGLAPWVTGAPHADLYVVGATLNDGRELLTVVPHESVGDSGESVPSIESGPGSELVALSASCTDQVAFHSVRIPSECVLAGPIENVMRSGSGAGTGGLQTSTLALGLSRAAANFLLDEASRRDDLQAAAKEITRELDQLESELLVASSGGGCDPAEIRGRANRMVLRATQAALTSAKGAGFVEGHPVGRWCREALFFLVWSCPAPVAQAHLCELAFGVDTE